MDTGERNELKTEPKYSKSRSRDHNAPLDRGKAIIITLASYTPLLIFMHDVIILTQNEAIGARPPPLAVAAPLASF